MANSYVELAPDQTGKKVQQFQNVVAASNVEAMAVAFQDSTGWNNSYVEVTDSTGKSIQYFKNTVSGAEVYAQALTLVDITGMPTHG